VTANIEIILTSELTAATYATKVIQARNEYRSVVSGSPQAPNREKPPTDEDVSAEDVTHWTRSGQAGRGPLLFIFLPLVSM
jgi:hypothetical protein